MNLDNTPGDWSKNHSFVTNYAFKYTTLVLLKVHILTGMCTFKKALIYFFHVYLKALISELYYCVLVVVVVLYT